LFLGCQPGGRPESNLAEINGFGSGGGGRVETEFAPRAPAFAQRSRVEENWFRV
jgi:hypothetical protein